MFALKIIRKGLINHKKTNHSIFGQINGKNRSWYLKTGTFLGGKRNWLFSSIFSDWSYIWVPLKIWDELESQETFKARGCWRVQRSLRFKKIQYLFGNGEYYKPVPAILNWNRKDHPPDSGHIDFWRFTEKLWYRSHIYSLMIWK